MLKVTALGSNTQSAAGAASGVADYLLGKADDQERATAQLLSPVAGTEQQGRYYADSIEGPGQWLGHGAARLSLHGVVNREAFERVLSGRDPATGARLLSARGSAGRTSLKVGNHTRTGPDGEVLYGVEDAASALGLRPEDVERLIGAGREQRIYAIPPFTKVVSLDFEDHPFEASKADRPCDLCGAAHSYLDEVIVDDAGGRMFVCSDTDFCAGRQARGHVGRLNEEAAE